MANLKDKLKNLAAKVTTVGKYVKIDDIIADYPDGVEVNGLTVKAAKNQATAYAFTFNDTENSDNDTDNGSDTDTEESYFYAESGDLKKIVSAWLTEMTVDEIDTALKENPITIRIDKIETSKGRKYIKANIVDTDGD